MVLNRRVHREPRVGQPGGGSGCQCTQKRPKRLVRARIRVQQKCHTAVFGRCVPNRGIIRPRVVQQPMGMQHAPPTDALSQAGGHVPRGHACDGVVAGEVGCEHEAWVVGHWVLVYEHAWQGDLIAHGFVGNHKLRYAVGDVEQCVGLSALFQVTRQVAFVDGVKRCLARSGLIQR